MRLKTVFYKIATAFELKVQKTMQDMEILQPENVQKLREGAERLGIQILSLGLITDIPKQKMAVTRKTLG
jgi:hypothetical protein